MSVINTNIKSLISQHALNLNSRALSSAMEQLSTGKRINSAADDAAGLAISSRMTAQIRGLNQAIRNANDGISMVQTAEGATIEITNMLQRMRELAVQSANGANSLSDRQALNDEFVQLKAEIQRIAEKTQWNGFNVLDGSVGDTGTVHFQVGANADDTIHVDFVNFKIDSNASAPSIQQLNLSSKVPDGGTPAGLMDIESVTHATISLQGVDNPITVNVDGTETPEKIAETLEAAIRAYSGYTQTRVEAGTSTINITDDQARTISVVLQGPNNATPPVVTDVVLSTQESPGNAADGDLSALAETTITTVDEANDAISSVDTALNVVNIARSEMGAVINRLTYAADNLSNISLNTSESRSRIQDADYAAATTELSRTQIIQQAATAVLAQANTDQQSVLKLLQS